MRCFYHPEQSLHNPLQYLRYGRVVDPKDLPIRTEQLLNAVKKHEIRIIQPDACGTEPLVNVHTQDFINFLQTAWDKWQQLPDERGPEVWPSTFPYWNARPDQDARPPCRPTAFSGQLGWYLGDLSVSMGEYTWLSTLRSAETAVAAAEDIISGAMQSYALCRPSGHHARSDRASGFCFINNAAVAARHLTKKFSKVAILDIDAHHGDGTQQIFYNHADVLTVSVHADPSGYYPFYTGYSDETGEGDGKGCNLNIPLPLGANGLDMLEAIDRAHRAIRDFGAEAIVLSLGYDAHEKDPIGVLKVSTEDFKLIGERIKDFNLPTLVVQEGGYAIEVISDCLDQFLQGFKG